MSESDLIFENTPLQNLKNILSEADASAQSDPDPVSGRGQESDKVQEGIAKAALKKIIEDLVQNQKQYLSEVVVGGVTHKLVKSQDVPAPKILDNPAIARLDSLLNKN